MVQHKVNYHRFAWYTSMYLTTINHKQQKTISAVNSPVTINFNFRETKKYITYIDKHKLIFMAHATRSFSQSNFTCLSEWTSWEFARRTNLHEPYESHERKKYKDAARPPLIKGT